MLSARHLSAHSCFVASEKNENRFCEVARSIVENIRRIGRLLGIVYSTIAKNRTLAQAQRNDANPAKRKLVHSAANGSNEPILTIAAGRMNVGNEEDDLILGYAVEPTTTPFKRCFVQ